MTHRLRTGVSSGRIDDADLGTFSIDDHIIEVRDIEDAEALVARHGHLSWAGSPADAEGGTGDAEDTEDADDGDSETTSRGTIDADDVTFTDSAGDTSAGSDAATDAAAYETYPRDELEAMEYRELQSLVSEGDYPTVTGRSSRDDIIDALAED